MKLKGLKARLAAIPDELENADVVFGANGLEGMFVVDSVTTGRFAGKVPESMTTQVVILWNGPVN